MPNYKALPNSVFHVSKVFTTLAFSLLVCHSAFATNQVNRCSKAIGDKSKSSTTSTTVGESPKIHLNKNILNLTSAHQFLETPFTFTENNSGRLLGPIVLHAQNSFSQLEQKLIQDLTEQSRSPKNIRLAKKKYLELNPNYFDSRKELNKFFKDGIEFGQLLITLTDGSKLPLSPFTSYNPDTLGGIGRLEKALDEQNIQKNMIQKIQIFHTHPGGDSSSCLLSSIDIDVSNELLSDLLIKGLEIHIYAISLKCGGKILSHYGIKQK